MPDLMTANGRALMLRRIEPNLRRLEADIERQAKPFVRSLKGVDTTTWAKIGGGAVAVTALVVAVSMISRAFTVPSSTAAKTAAKRVSAPRKRIAAPAASATKTQARKTPSRASA